MEDLPDSVTTIATRLEALEKRVYALEHPAATITDAVVERPTASAAELVREQPGATTAGTFSVLGKALLGIAGAYLLRALAEAQVLPNALIAGVALAYALAWLGWASRAKNTELLAPTVYSCTSALILAPMLWELTLRFSVLSASVAACVVAGFAVIGSVLGVKRHLTPVIWISNLTAAGLALALSIASRQMIPFIGVLVLMVLIQEYQATRGRAGGVRILVSLTADVAIWVLIYVYGGPESARASYPHLSAAMLTTPGAILFLIVAAGVIYQTVLTHKRISIFEIVQMTASFLLGACGLLYFGSHADVVALGICCLLMAVAGYWVTLRQGADEDGRNLKVFATWSGALLLSGSVLALPGRVMPLWMGSWAVVASWIGARLFSTNLQLHALVFLIVAGAGSGLLGWITGEFISSQPQNAGGAVYFVMLCAVACYACMVRGGETDWKSQGRRIAFALLVTGAAGALAVQGLTGLVAMKVIPEAHHLAFIRTLAVCLAAIGLGYSGARWRRAELTKLGYAALGLLVLKLVVEDIHHGRLAFTAASIFLFAITLIAVPRVAKARTAN